MPSTSYHRQTFLLSTSTFYHPDPARIWIVELQELCLRLLFQASANDQ